ncbi:hypothetical protein TIFTF001_035761 [Ficus carica]|uniref:Uncharacterized protein n=1 Tax=Ficus carica TaxID=3494 RepID=A0AA88JC26_FICCA|nr:hypothetical protein TIFTF001_035761 [Ficus carica]
MVEEPSQSRSQQRSGTMSLGGISPASVVAPLRRYPVRAGATHIASSPEEGMATCNQRRDDARARLHCYVTQQERAGGPDGMTTCEQGSSGSPAGVTSVATVGRERRREPRHLSSRFPIAIRAVAGNCSFKRI